MRWKHSKIKGVKEVLTSIKGRSVLITGASKGIGKGITRVFAAQGAKILITARNLKVATNVAEEITKSGGIASACSADIGNWEDAQKMASTAAKRYGGIDILCANAGIFPAAKLEEMTPEEWDTVLDTNLKGMFLSIKSCVPYLKNSDQGRIIVTSSITGPITGFPGWTHYAASKAGQLGFMRTAAIELSKYGITVNAVLPGNIMTEGLADMGEDYLAAMAASIPLKRLGSVEDIANAALFLASKEASYITGQTIIVDGGQTLPESLEALEQA